MQDEQAADLDLGGEGGGESPDAFAGIEADGGLGAEEPTPVTAQAAPGALGGDGETLEEALGGEEPLPPDEAPINGSGSDPLADAPAAEPTPAEAPPAEPEPEPAPEPEPEPEPAAEPKAKSASKKGGGKKGTAERKYVVLQKTEAGWVEAIPEGIVAANAEGAIRSAYAELIPEDKPDSVTLAVIPEHYWNPKTVQAKVRHERAVEIS